MIDYLANPAILVKNLRVLDNLVTNYVPKLTDNETWFKEIQKHINHLMGDSYDFKQSHLDSDTV